jgi:hypothetical protein
MTVSLYMPGVGSLIIRADSLKFSTKLQVQSLSYDPGTPIGIEITKYIENH